jgi:hypothetical protein
MPEHLPPALAQWLAAHAHSWPWIIALGLTGFAIEALSHAGDRR